MTEQITNLALLDKINRAAGNPSTILQTVIDMVEDVNEGEVAYVDASNPAVTQIETSAVIHAASIQQHIAALRRLYPILAQTPEDLYHHMSYRDYMNRFASPSIDPFFFFVPLSQLINRGVVVDGTDYRMIRIPRGTQITVNKYVTFMLQYPIDIKYFDTHSVEVSFEASVPSPLQTLSTNVIVSDVINEPSSNETWVRFSVPAPQVKVNKVNDNLQAGRYFVKDVEFTDQYCMARVWYRNSSISEWREMKTTYSPSVYDPTEPTMQLKVIGQTLNMSLPLVYQTTGQVIGEVRVDIYTTKGSEIIKLNEYQLEDFVIDMSPLDTLRDIDQYTAAAVQVNISCRSLSVMSSGKDALTFEQLRERVINNSVGPQDIPITNINIKSAIENAGFELVPNVDVVTNRIFLATRSLPPPTNSKLVTAANVGMVTYITDNPSTVNHPWVKVNGPRTTFLSKNLYQSQNGVIRLLSAQEVENLKLLPSIAKINAVNNIQYLYTPFYYVIDTSSSELAVRIYELDDPSAEFLSFKEQNASLQLTVNTSAYTLVKADNGYELTITTNSGNFYKELPDNEVFVQLGVKLNGSSSTYAYWPGELVGKSPEGERIYKFTINTNYDLNGDDQIIFTNGKIDSSSETPVEVNLTSSFDIFHITSSLTTTYKPTLMDEQIGKFMLPNPVAAVTKESITLKFGNRLDGLWSRGRTLPDQDIYERYNQDVYEVAEQDIFADPPFNVVNGKVVYNYLYRRGEKILDKDGNPVIKYHAGDIVMDRGNPVISETKVGSREFDILMVDGRHYFVTDESFLDYNRELVQILTDWIVNDISAIQAKTLEKTKVFFYPKNQLSTVTIVVGDYTNDIIPSGQSIEIDVFAKDSILRDIDRRNSLNTKVINFLSNWVSGTTVSVSDAIRSLIDIYGDSAKSIKMSGLGEKQDLQMVIMAFDEQRMSLRRKLDTQEDGTFIVKEDVTVNYYKADPVRLID